MTHIKDPSELDPLTAYKNIAPLCEEHSVLGGARAGCLVCSIIKLRSALSRVSYAAGPPNEMGVSVYDVFPDEDQVVLDVENALSQLRGTIKRIRQIIGRSNPHPH